MTQSVAGYGLNPVFAGKLEQLLRLCHARGLDFRVAQGLRTPQRQALYYCQWDGRTPSQVDAAAGRLKARGAPWLAALLAGCRDTPRKPGWLTNALPGEGWHQWGEAADCYCWRGGVMVEDGGDPCYAAFAELAEGLGLTAGYRFKPRDSGHVQLRSAAGAAAVYPWRRIDEVMRERFGGKPALAAGGR